MEKVPDLSSGHPEECKEFIIKHKDKKGIFVSPEKTLNDRFVKANSKFQSTDVAFKGLQFGASDTDSYEFTEGLLLKPRDEIKHETNCERTESNLEYNVLFWKLAQEFKTLKSHDFITNLERAAKQLGMRLTFNVHNTRTVKNGLTYFVSELYLDSVELAIGQGLNLDSSKYDTYTKAIEKIFSSSMHFPLESRGVGIDISQKAFCNQKENTDFSKYSSLSVEHKQTCIATPAQGKKKKQKTTRQSGSEFVIIQPVQKGMKSAEILRESSKANKTKLKFRSKSVDPGYMCQIYLCGELLGVCNGTTKSVSEERVSTMVLQKLGLRCWTILRKVADVKDETYIKVEDLVEKVDEPISTDNIGNQLLQKMGWTGGGIGKNGNKGNIEPISVNTFGNIRQTRSHGDRKGLGSQSFGGLNMDFTSKVQTILKDYAQSSDPDSLAFLCKFFPKEKAIIEFESGKLGLKTTKHGSKRSRLVIVSHDWNAHELLSQLMTLGGSSREYTLVPPKSMELSSNHDEGTESILDIIPPLDDLTFSSAGYSVNVNEGFYSTKVDGNATSVQRNEDISYEKANEYASCAKKDDDLSSANVDSEFTSENVKNLTSENVDKCLAGAIDGEDNGVKYKNCKILKSQRLTNFTLKSNYPEEKFMSGEVNIGIHSNKTHVDNSNCNIFSVNNDETEPVPSPFMITRNSLELIPKEVLKMDFDQKVKTFLMKFSRLANPDNLIFPPEFSKKQRASISVEAQNIGLITCDIFLGGKAVLIVNKPTPLVPINDKDLSEKAVVSNEGKDSYANQIISGHVSKTLMKPKDSGIIPNSDVKNNFVDKVKTILMNFSQHPNANGLLFLSHFNENKCWIIRHECLQLGLISKFDGYGPGTYVVIGHKNILTRPSKDKPLSTVDYVSPSHQRVNESDSGEVTLEIPQKPTQVDNEVSQDISWPDKALDNMAKGDSCVENDSTFECSLVNIDDICVTRATDIGLISKPDVKLDFLQKVKNVLVEYVKSGSKNKLTFADKFTEKERVIIRQESGRLGLQIHEKQHQLIVTTSFHIEMGFMGKIAQILVDFVKFPTLDHLLFSSEFTIAERGIILQIAHELGLQSRDIDHGPVRQLTIHQKWAVTRHLREKQDNGIRGANSEKTNDVLPDETPNYIPVNRLPSGELVSSTDLVY